MFVFVCVEVAFIDVTSHIYCVYFVCCPRRCRLSSSRSRLSFPSRSGGVHPDEAHYDDDVVTMSMLTMTDDSFATRPSIDRVVVLSLSFHFKCTCCTTVFIAWVLKEPKRSFCIVIRVW